MPKELLCLKGYYLQRTTYFRAYGRKVSEISSMPGVDQRESSVRDEIFASSHWRRHNKYLGSSGVRGRSYRSIRPWVYVS